MFNSMFDEVKEVKHFNEITNLRARLHDTQNELKSV